MNTILIILTLHALIIIVFFLGYRVGYKRGYKSCDDLMMKEVGFEGFTKEDKEYFKRLNQERTNEQAEG